MNTTSENIGHDVSHGIGRLSRRMCWLYPLALGTLAVFFLLGDIGWWNDDYFFCQRDVVTGEADRLILTRREPYLPPLDRLNPWRPLHLTGTAALITTFWERPEIVHAVGAGIHCLVAAVFYVFMRQIGRSRHAAGAMAMILLLHPAAFEVPFWASTYATGLSCTLMLSAFLLMVQLARSGRWMWAIGIPLCAGGIVGLNEQPASGLPFLPFVYFLGMRQPGAVTKTVRMHLVQALVPTAVAGAVVVAYMVNLRVNGQPGLGTSTESFTAVADMPATVGRVLRGMGDRAIFKFEVLGATSWGLSTLLTAPLRAVAWVGMVGIGGILALWAWTTTPTHAVGGAPVFAKQGGGVNALLTVMLGGMMVILACVPQAMIVGYPANSRTYYLVLLSGLLAASGVGDLVGMAMARVPAIAKPYRLLTGLMVLCVTLWGGLMYVGVQGRYQAIYRADVDQARQLRELYPNPAPDSVFLPLASYHKAVDTGYEYFDSWLVDAWQYSWSTQTFLKRQYKRSDIHLGYRMRFDEAVVGVGIEEFTFVWNMDWPFGDGPQHFWVKVPMEKAVPFVIDPEGRVHVVTHWDVRPKDGGPPFLVELPQLRSAVLNREVRALTFQWPRPEEWQGD